MKTGRLFWGVLLTTLGLLFLCVKFNIINSSFSFVWDLWPLIFIFWGLLVLIKQPIIKPIISSLFGIFVALFIFGGIYSLFSGFGFEFDDDANFTTYSNNFYEDMDKNVITAQLNFASGAGAFSIDGTTDKLIEGHSRGWFSDYDINTNIEDSAAFIDIHLHEKNFQFFGKKLRNRINMSLNPDVIWNIDLSYGAANGKFDLSPFKVYEVKLGAGAASTEIKLGDRSDETELHAEMGVSSLTILVPKTVGCKLIGDTFLVSRQMPGFTKKSNDAYYSENYDSTTKKLNIYLSSGVSSLSIKYY